MKRNRISALVLCALLLLSALTGCGTTVVVAPEGGTPAASTAPDKTAAPETQPAQGGVSAPVKTGLAILTDLSGSKDAGEEDGSAKSELLLVAVTVGDDGVIDRCVIDMVQAKIGFNASGALTTDPATTFPSKNELGDDYGMKKASSIGKEWNEQAAALADYAVGKTVAELKGMAVGEDGKAADADLAASVTLYIGSFVDGIEAAVNSASHLGASQGDRLSLTSETSMSKSKDADGDKEGAAQAYATAAAVTFSGDTISSCYIDAVQANVNFDTAGKITTDLTAAPQTKNQLGDGYGMKKASSIGKEWNEQAAALAGYAVGKTVDQLKGMAVGEDGKAADADLAASVTLYIGSFVDGIEAAVNSASHMGASQGDKLSLASQTSMSKSKDASADKDGVAQAYATIAAVTFSGEVITSCYIDAVQANVNFDTAGHITTDLTAAPQTKNQLGDGYGLKQASSIGKEWNEQAAGFCAYVTGKTVAEIKGLAVDEGGKAADADLAATVTVGIGEFQTLIEKAAK